MALKHHLGLPLIAREDIPECCPGCKAEVDVYGDHLISCPRNDFSRRHRAVQDGVASILAKTGMPYQREVPVPGCPDQSAGTS